MRSVDDAKQIAHAIQINVRRMLRSIVNSKSEIHRGRDHVGISRRLNIHFGISNHHRVACLDLKLNEYCLRSQRIGFLRFETVPAIDRLKIYFRCFPLNFKLEGIRNVNSANLWSNKGTLTSNELSILALSTLVNTSSTMYVCRSRY